MYMCEFSTRLSNGIEQLVVNVVVYKCGSNMKSNVVVVVFQFGMRYRLYAADCYIILCMRHKKILRRLHSSHTVECT